MKITLLCSDPFHPINPYLLSWAETQAGQHEIQIIRKASQLQGGDILFLISCVEIIKLSERIKFKNVLLIHASDLPKGRGWSPHIWELIQGAELITLSLLEAEDAVDSGMIWKKISIKIPKHALWDEINHILFSAEIQLIQDAIRNFGKIKPTAQLGTEYESYYPKRSPNDSRIDPFRSIADQFDQIRVCDPNRFPAYFDLLGQRYILKLEKKYDK